MAALALVGAGLSVYSAIKEGEDKKQAYEMEASLKRSQAAQVELAALREIDLTKARGEKIKQAQLASFGASGVSATTGSPLMMMEETAGEVFAETQAIRQAANYRKGTLFTEAGFSSTLGQQGEDAGYIRAGSSLITAASNSPYSYSKPKKTSGLGF